MAASHGGLPPTQLAGGENLWRLIHYSWWQPNANGVYIIRDRAFIGNISLVRGDYLTTDDVDQYVDTHGNKRFLKVGIAVLEVNEIRTRTGASLNVTSDPFGWPPYTHVELIRRTGGKALRATHPEVSELINIANASPLLRKPKP